MCLPFYTNTKSTLIENSVYGGTVKEAVESLILKDISSNLNNSGKSSELLMEAFIMGYENIVLKVSSGMKEILINDGSFYSVASCAYNLYFLNKGTMLFSSNNNDFLKELLLQGYNKAISLIPGFYAVPSEEENQLIDKLKNLYHITLDLNLDVEIFKEALNSLTNKKDGNSAVEGAALGLLLGLNEIDSSLVIKNAEGYFYGTPDKFLKSASFLKGLFSTARDIVLSEEKMIKAIDNVVKNLEEEDFLKLLPELRLSFSFFSPNEIDEIGEKVADSYGIGERKIFSIDAIDPEELNFALKLDSFAFETLKEWGILND